MRAILFIAVFLSCWLSGAGQINLVPNPSFELYDTCPYNGQQNILDLYDWFQPNEWDINGGTDFYDTCSNGGGADVPLNIFGQQNAHLGGGYIGARYFISPGNPDAGREYAEVKLNDSMVSGKKYCVHAYFSLAEYSDAGVANIGFYLSKDSLLYTSQNYNYIGPSAHINYGGSPIIDTLNWTLVKGIFISLVGENFITIGNFNPGNQVAYTCLGTPCGGAYYYIDDVSVVRLPELDAGYTDTICRNDSITLNGTISETWPGMSFEWLPHAGLNNPYSLVTSASPSVTTTYTLTVSCATCDVPCLSDIPDSVTINVLPQVVAPADDTVCLGDSLLLTGTISEQWIGMQYEWLPHTGIANPYSISTMVSPASATSYTLIATCPTCGLTSCSTLSDSVMIAVRMDCNPVLNEMIVPTLVGSNQRWEILFLQPNTHVKIFDERGRIIFESENYQNNWVPTISGSIYFYQLTLSDGTKSTGKIAVN